jgi:hypothetical protein
VSAQLEPWSRRISVKEVVLLGGEPALNPDLTNIINLSRSLFPETPIVILTNGFLLSKHEGLAECLLKNRVQLGVSVHENTPAYRAKIQPALDLLSQWQRMGIVLEVWNTWQCWTKPYVDSPDGPVPFSDNNKYAAWSACNVPARKCAQLRDNCVWKCPLVAYMPLVCKKLPKIASQWPELHNYQPLRLSATDNEIVDFFARGAEDVCKYCSILPEKTEYQDSSFSDLIK